MIGWQASGLRFQDSSGPRSAVQQSIYVLDDTQTSDKIIPLEKSADSFQLLVLHDVQRLGGVYWRIPILTRVAR